MEPRAAGGVPARETGAPAVAVVGGVVGAAAGGGGERPVTATGWLRIEPVAVRTTAAGREKGALTVAAERRLGTPGPAPLTTTSGVPSVEEMRPVTVPPASARGGEAAERVKGVVEALSEP